MNRSIVNIFGVLILTSISFVVSMAWNDAMRGLIDRYYPVNRDQLKGRVIYAISVTVFAVIIATGFAKFTTVKAGII